MFHEIVVLKNKISVNRDLRFAVKAVSLMLVFLIFLGSFSKPEEMRAAWDMSAVAIFVLCGVDVMLAKQNKRLQWQIYELEKAEQAQKRKEAQLYGEPVPDIVLNREIMPPSEKVSSPIAYYVIVAVLDILVKVLMIN